MCTALSFKTKSHYFGRTLDIDCSYGEEICVIPRNFPFNFRKAEKLNTHHAIIGMATVVDEAPLLYDAVNEYGLAMAGLNFPGNAYYPPIDNTCDNVCPFEFIPWILGQCRTVPEARELIGRINLVNIPYSDKLSLAPLHWIIADSEQSVVVEPMHEGIRVYNNPIGVMTNNPPFDYQLFNLNNYRNLTVDNGNTKFSDSAKLDEYCEGLGLVGLPGDVSSMSRFVRAAFYKTHLLQCDLDETSVVSQFFHIMSSVEMLRGACRTASGKWDITVYTSCMNADTGVYYYTTYNNHRISCVDMHRTDLDAVSISRFSLIDKEQIDYRN